jgi:hypothetical protein
MRVLQALVLPALLVLVPRLALADDAGVVESVKGCVDRIPEGGAKPVIVEKFPDRGLSGYAATLQVTVEHGKGESVLPGGLELQSSGDAASALKSAGFQIPNQDGGAGARLQTSAPDPKRGDRVTTILELPLLLLPLEPGRHTLTLPPLPIAVQRANNDVAVVCTRSHTIVVEDPISSTPDAQPKPNPPPRPQREEWKTLEHALEWIGAGVVLGGLLAYALYRFMKRERPVPPLPPPRPPWETALEKLDEIRHAGLLETARLGEFFDRVNDVVRSYLGARYGFDGLESTSDEILASLRTVEHFALPVAEITLFLQECDLVKFADLTPTNEACIRALDQGERIVRTTMPSELRMALASSPAVPA